MGAVGTENIQGEQQQKLDVYADEVFLKAFADTGIVAGLASEESDDFVSINPNGEYVIAIDPLDGSSNIDVNVSIGTIIGIFKRVTPKGTSVELKDFLQEGTKQVAACYTLYGSSTMLVYTTGNGAHSFTLNPADDEFYLSTENLECATDGKIYSVNEGNLFGFDKPVQDYIKACQEKAMSGRYIGSLVADFHRNMLKGGIYMYPATTKTPNGKLRLLYEGNPLGFIAEQAGGKSTNGKQRTLEITPTELHQRCPLFIGSANMVDSITK